MMPLADDTERALVARPDTRAHWHTALLSLSLCLLLLSYRSTVAELVSTWANSATFAHGMLIPPVTVWLIWRQRSAWQALPVRPAPLMLIALALAGLGWLLAALGSVPVLQQFCLFGMLIALATLLQGLQRTRVQAFPLLYLLLAVPCGEFLIAPLIDITATMTVLALRVSGVPVLRESNFLTLPTGNWSVMDACSGLRYLIATIAIASLYAYLSFYRWQRRLLFMLAALLLPILANGVRAFGIVLLGHYSNMRWATGIDHLLYGWLFFGLLLAVLLRGGAHWRESAPPRLSAPAQRVTTEATAAQAVSLGLAIAALAITALWPLLLQQLQGRMAPYRALTMQLPEPPAPWQHVSRHGAAGAPTAGSGLTLWSGEYRNSGTSVALQLRHPLQHGATPVRGEEHTAYWQVLATQQRSIRIGTQQLFLQQLHLRDGPRKLQVWRFYRLAGSNVARDWEIRVRQAAMLLRGQRAMVTEIRLSAEYSEVDDTPDAAMATLLQAMYGAIVQEIDHADH